MITASIPTRRRSGSAAASAGAAPRATSVMAGSGILPSAGHAQRDIQQGVRPVAEQRGL